MAKVQRGDQGLSISLKGALRVLSCPEMLVCLDLGLGACGSVLVHSASESESLWLEDPTH